MHSHDPFHPTASYLPPDNGPQSVSEHTFRVERWQRAGATDEQLDQLLQRHLDRSVDEMLEHNAWIDSVSDPELTEQLPNATEQQLDDAADTDITAVDDEPGEPGEPPSPIAAPVEEYSGTVAEILAKVGSDQDKAAAALAVEEAREAGTRVSLVNELNRIIRP